MQQGATWSEGADGLGPRQRHQASFIAVFRQRLPAQAGTAMGMAEVLKRSEKLPLTESTAAV